MSGGGNFSPTVEKIILYGRIFTYELYLSIFTCVTTADQLIH